MQALFSQTMIYVMHIWQVQQNQRVIAWGIRGGIRDRRNVSSPKIALRELYRAQGGWRGREGAAPFGFKGAGFWFSHSPRRSRTESLPSAAGLTIAAWRQA